nr:2-amino-4-hydroxy-6-hydroxymethyldihydropteridine diphosphokinase [uncultured Desulfobulbus sp.]
MPTVGQVTKTQQHTAVLGLGSNVGRSAQILQDAWHDLQDGAEIVGWRLSSPYRSKPVDMESSHWFVNAVGILKTVLPPIVLLERLQAVEARFGRLRDPQKIGYQDRTLDLDLLLYDDIVLANPELVVPHPRMRQRRFVLEPLLEIAEDIGSSPFTESVGQWALRHLGRLADQSVVRGSWNDG